MKQYIILLNENGAIGCGNDWTIPTEYKQHAKILEVANNMIRWNKDAKYAYTIAECQYTQKACEMNISEFSEYVKRVGKRII